MILLYAGRRPDETNFPPANEKFVAEQVERALRGLVPRLVVGSAAAGADIIVLEKALDLGIPAKVIVAGAKEEFAESSVADKDADWVERYETVLSNERVELVELRDAVADYRAVTERIWSTAAQENETAVALIVSNERQEGGHTEELARRQAENGGQIITIDPTVGAS